MRHHSETARRLASATLSAALEAGAEQAEVIATAGTTALTRFAGNRIHQNVAESGTEISVRAVLGNSIGVASTNRTDDVSLADCCVAAVRAASVAPADNSFPGLPGPASVEIADRAAKATRSFDAEDRAKAVRTIVEHSRRHDLVAAGGIKVTDQGIAVVNSLGVDVAQDITGLRATALSMDEHEGGGSGWSSFVCADAGEFDAEKVGERAAFLALRSRYPRELPSGAYRVVLAPEAVADLVEFLGWLSFGAKPVHEGRSPLSDKIGEPIVSPLVTITDDATAADAMGLTFDFEGQPRSQVSLIETGVARGFVTDSYWAARLGTANTGHALPAPNSYGPLPLNLQMAPGDSTLEELIAQTERGVFVTRFHYVNVEDPVPVTLTGMTRDGTFLIEEGKLSHPLKNLRFTQSVIEALGNVVALTRDREYIGSETNPVLVPGMLVDGFNFTGQTR